MAIQNTTRPPAAPVAAPVDRLKTMPLTKKVARDNGMSDSYLETVVSIIPPAALDVEIAAFLYQVARTGLDPMARQIYIVGRYDRNAQRDKFTTQVGIDGYRLIADRTGLYAGSSDPLFDDDLTQYQLTKTGRPNPTTATITVSKLLSNGAIATFTATALWDSYFPGDAMGYMWKKFPMLMLSKVAEALALRKAFPAQLSGLMISEEMHQAGESAEATEILAGELGYRNANVIPTLQKADVVPGFDESWFVSATGMKFTDVLPDADGDMLLRKVWQYAVGVEKGNIKPGLDTFLAHFDKQPKAVEDKAE